MHFTRQGKRKEPSTGSAACFRPAGVRALYYSIGCAFIYIRTHAAEKRSLLLPLDDVVLILVDGVGGDDAADAGRGVYDAVPAQDGTRIEDRVAAYLHKIAQNGTHLSPSGEYIGFCLYHHRGLVRLDVGCDRASAHVALVAQNGVAHVVVVGGLNFIEENGILQLCRVAYHAVGAHQSGAPDKGTVAYLGLRPDDAGCA